MVGMFLKDREAQYTANRDEITNTWRILDTWHEDLAQLGPDDEVEDTSKAERQKLKATTDQMMSKLNNEVNMAGRNLGQSVGNAAKSIEKAAEEEKDVAEENNNA